MTILRLAGGKGLLWRSVAFVLSLGVSEWFVWRHIFWRDEALGVMIAAHSPTLPVLLSHMGYEGTPGLWHFLLWITRFLPPWWDLKIWTALVTAATLYVLFYLLDISWPLALVYALGVQLGTYSFMSRSYGLSVLLLLLFACFEKRWRHEPVRQNALLLSVVLFLLTQTNVHSVLIAAGIFLYLSVQNLLRQRPLSWLPVAALGLGALAAVLQVLPPPDLGPWAGWQTGEAAARYASLLLSLPYRLFLPFYINGSWVVQTALDWVRGLSGGVPAIRVAGALVVWLPAGVGLYALLRRALRTGRRGAAVTLAIAVPLLLLTALGTFKYFLELQQMYLLVPYLLALYIIAGPGRRKADALVWVLLSVHLLNVAMNAGPMLTVPFDDSQAIVSWIESHGYGPYLRSGAVAVFPDPGITPISLYGNLPNGAYALSAGRYETYTPWDKRESGQPWTLRGIVLPEHLPLIAGPYLLVTYYPTHLDFNDVQARLLTRLPGGAWVHWPDSDGASIYLVQPKPAGGTQP